MKMQPTRKELDLFPVNASKEAKITTLILPVSNAYTSAQFSRTSSQGETTQILYTAHEKNIRILAAVQA